MRRLALMVAAWVAYAGDLPVAYDPFDTAQKVIKSAKPVTPRYYRPISKPLRLYAIMNDKAFINKKFYTIGAIIDGFRLVAIAKDHVVLQKGRYKKILFLPKKQILRVTKR